MDLSFMDELIGKKLQVERGGPDKLSGTLLRINRDYIVLETEERQIVYVNAHHIKSVSRDIVEDIGMTTPTDVEDAHAPFLIDADDFETLLSKLHLRLIRVNNEGPNSLEGVLLDVEEDTISIIHGTSELVTFPIFHIKSVRLILDHQKHNNTSESANSSTRHKK